MGGRHCRADQEDGSGKKTPLKVNGRTRITDGTTATTINEVKNVSYQANTQQLRDLARAAHDAGKEFVLWVRHETVLSGPLEQAYITGQLILRRFGWP